MLKDAVVEGGSTYTPELINGFLSRFDKFPINELWLMDIDKERLDIVGGFAQRMVKLTPHEIARNVHAHPMLSEVLMETAHGAEGQPIHI
jgi:alpha-galactosidase/6-phospho-beta-glucosidase family protein